MYKILALVFSTTLETTFFLYTLRGYNRAMLLRLFPGIFVQAIKMLCSCFFSKRKNKSMYGHLIISTVTYEAVACLSTFNSYKISGVANAVASSSKFPFISFFSYVMLKKRFTKVQVLGQLIIFAGIFYNAISNDGKGKANEIASQDFLFPFIAIVISGISSSFATVYFEKYIKPKIDDFNTFTMNYSLVHMCVSICSSILELTKIGDLDKIKLTICYSQFYILVIATVAHVYIVTYLCTKIGPIARNLLFLVISNVSSIIITYKEDKILKIKALVSLFVVNVGICFYEMDKLKKYWRDMRNKETGGLDQKLNNENEWKDQIK